MEALTRWLKATLKQKNNKFLHIQINDNTDTIFSF